jgi:Ca-activated chloride channel family protein
MIEFSNAPRRWKAAPVAATEAARREALKWLANLRASGSTEMRAGILEALATVRKDAQRQVVLITDGQIGFESQVVAAICDRLPASSRLHTVGVGSAVNRSLTGPSARAGHGIEVIVGLGEDAERAASRIVARTNAPLLVDLEIRGEAVVEHAPVKLPDLFAGAPALVSVALKPEGGELMVRGRTPEGTWEQRIRVPALAAGEGNRAVVALFGREAVEDLETRLAAGGEAREIDASIERIGVDFQISTRLTSWVAVSEDRTVDPSDPLRRERMPHELPYGVSAEGLGLRPAAPVSAGMAMAAAPSQSVIKVELGESSRSDLRARAGKALMGAAAPPPGLKPASAAPSRAALARTAAPAKDETRADVPEIDPEAAPAKARRRGLLGRVRDLFVSSQGAYPQPHQLRGRIALKKGNQLVVEVFADLTELAWAPSGEARITLANGQVVTATIDMARTTRAGTIAAGATARLALEVAPGALTDDVRSITIELDGATVTIEV